MTKTEKLERVKDLRPIDDLMFEILARDTKVCEEILRTILEDKDLIVEYVEPQKSERNLYGRSVRLDALCTLGNGTKCNIEVQRTNKDNHLKRARFNASSITAYESNPSETFDNVLELYIVYISEFDFLKGGLTTYHIDKVIRENGQIIDDGLHEIFVNTTIDDGTDIADLMSCFVKKEVSNPKFPILSNAVKEIKSTEGGESSMSKLMEDLLAEGEAKGKAEGILEGKLNQLVELVQNGMLQINDAAKVSGMPVEEFKKLL